MKDETMTPPHAVKVMRELDAEIKVRVDEIDQLRAGQRTLLELYGTGPLEEAHAEQPDRSAKKRAKKKGTEGTQTPSAAARPPLVMAPGTALVETPRVASPETLKIMVAARTCAEPFTGQSLVVATGCELSKCRNALSRWRIKGWVANAEGGYKRTGEFPVATPAD